MMMESILGLHLLIIFIKKKKIEHRRLNSYRELLDCDKYTM